MSRLARAAAGLLGAWIIACELHALGLAWLPVGPEKWLHLVAMGAGAALCLVRATVRREERGAWVLLGAGVLAWTLGELYFTAVLWSDASPPVPSLADAGYLSLPPLVFAGLIALARSRIRGLPRTLWIDGLTAGLATGAVSAALVFHPILRAVGGQPLAVATNLAYPIADLLLLGLLGGLLAVGGRRLDRRFGVLALGILLFWGADTTYLIKSAQGTWVSGGPYDPGWWSIAPLFALAAWLPVGPRRARSRRSALITVPIAFALVSLVVLVIGTRIDVSLPAVGLATAALIAVLVRLLVTFRAHQAMLRRSLAEASTDPLTGLGNRRALWLSLVDHADVEGTPLVLGLLDLNGFKSYNDRFGHAAGDALLRRLAVGLNDSLGSAASVYRMGGDEFCVVLRAGPDADRLLHRACHALTEYGDGFAISAAVGSVRMPEEAADPEDALRLADQRMYANKHAQRRSGAALEVKQALVSALTQRDPQLGGRSGEVAVLAELTARALVCPDEIVETIRLAAELHDIGKMAIPEPILAKPGPLSVDEWSLVREHAAAGERIVAASPALADIAPLVRASHERWDGGGYPDRLAGTGIPLGARIIAVCDAFLAMTSDRPYRRAMSAEVALAELRSCAGAQFDPAVVAAFTGLAVGRDLRGRLRQAGSDASAPDPSGVPPAPR